MRKGQPDLEVATRATVAAAAPRITADDGVEAPSNGFLMPGTTLGQRYEIVRRLGSGAMGAVYEAVQHPLERRVAVKVINPLLAGDPELRQRFAAEGRVASQIKHPNVVEIIDQGVQGATPYLVMELLEGESLGDRMEREGAFEPDRAVALITPLLRALAFVHARGVVHRDIKPDNIFLARDGDVDDVPRILDLGIAVTLGDVGRRATATGAMLGTPSYMAPEQVTSARDVTASADQYAIGCVLYEMLTGRLPVEADNLHGFLVAKTTRAPTPIDAHRPGLPAKITSAIMRAVARDPAERFADMNAFLSALSDDAGAAAVARPEAPLVRAPGARPRALVRVVVVVAGSIAAITAAAVLLQRRAPVTEPSLGAPPPRVTAAPAPRAEVDPVTLVGLLATDAAVSPEAGAASVSAAEAPPRPVRPPRAQAPSPARGRLLFDPSNPLRPRSSQR